MSKPYENLEANEKLLGTIHFPGKTGPRFEEVLKAIQHQLDNLILSAADLVKDSFQISAAVSGDLDEIGEFLGLVRLSAENDNAYRQRIETTASTFETVTKDAILDLFEEFLGKRPYFYESFRTKVLTSGETTENLGGEFTLIFEIPITLKSEQLRVASGGTSVIVTDETIETPETTAVSDTTSVATNDTTIYVASVDNFPSWGEIIIDDEWVSYGSTQTSPAAFLDCVRGLYTTDPATHNTATDVTEGCTKVFLEGTNTIIYESQDGTTLYVSGGAYDWDTYFDVQYRISGEGLKEEFDTAEEIGAALDQLRAVGFDYKAAGIKANISMGLVLRSWFQASREVVSITDSLSMDVSEIWFLEYFTWSAAPDRIVFFESAWDDSNYQWDKTLWTQAYWDGDSWERIDGPKGWYNVEISAHT